MPVTLREETGQDAAERCLLVEESDSANAERMVAALCQPGNDIRRVEHAGGGAGGFASGEAGREEARVVSRRRGRGEEAGEERLVSRVGEAPRGVAFLPAPARQRRIQ